MNRRDRDNYRPQCARCRMPVVDIEWLDATTFGGEDFVVGNMTCWTPDCYDARGSRRTEPLGESA